MITHAIKTAMCVLFGHYTPVAEDRGPDRQCVRCWRWYA